ncbi:LpxI family protein [Bosea thiooxidans]|nr:UDP-2,3-diacylglucosamine diphosphatase LpxI [Bosea sp. (in: a-proteobacteria)]
MTQPAGDGAGPLALLAGGGDFPVELTRILVGRGESLFVAALEGVADPVSFPGADVRMLRLGQVGSLLDELQRRSIRDVVMLGGLPRPSFGALRPELATLKYLPYFARAFRGGDDHLLSRVVRFFEHHGFRVHGPADIAPELAAPVGPLGTRQATEAQRELFLRGFSLLDALSPFDVGQAAILADHRVVAIEAAEGTDAMIERVADLVARRRLRLDKRDGVLVKAPKTGQDLRVDMPAIGPQTLHNVAQAGLAGIALKAGQVLVGDRAGLGRLADELGLFIEGVA